MAANLNKCFCLACCILVFFCLSSSENSKELQTCVNKMETDSAIILPSSTLVRFREIRKYLKRRLRYSSSHPGSFNPAIITNQGAHLIYGNTDGKKNSEKRSGRKRTFLKISNFFLNTSPISIVAGKFDNSNRNELFLRCRR